MGEEEQDFEGKVICSVLVILSLRCLWNIRGELLVVAEYAVWAQRRDLSYNYLSNVWFENVVEGGGDFLGRKLKMKSRETKHELWEIPAFHAYKDEGVLRKEDEKDE